VLSLARGGAVSESRQHRFADIVAGVVGEVGGILGLSEVGHVRQGIVGLLQEALSPPGVDRHGFDAFGLDERSVSAAR